MSTVFIAIIVGVISAITMQSRKNDSKATSSKPFFANRLTSVETKKKQKERTADQSKSPVLQEIFPTKERRGGRGANQKTSSQTNEQLQNIYEPAEAESPIYSFEAPEHKNLASAIIWSEILGPPRSKNPHYKRKDL